MVNLNLLLKYKKECLITKVYFLAYLEKAIMCQSLSFILQRSSNTYLSSPSFYIGCITVEKFNYANEQLKDNFFSPV